MSVIYDPILGTTRFDRDGMLVTGTQSISGVKTFYDKVVQNGTDSTAGDGWNIQNNGFVSNSPYNTTDTGFVHSISGVPVWAEQTYREENGEFWYLYSVPAKANTIVVSDGGRIGINNPTNIANYHTTYVDPISGLLNDFEVDGLYNRNYDTMFAISIAATGDVDIFQYRTSTDAGSTWTSYTTAYCSLTAVPLGADGNTCWFENTSGHNLYDAWAFTAFSQLPAAAFTVRPTMATEVNTTTDYTLSAPSWNDITHDCATVEGNANVFLPIGDGNTTKGAVYIGNERKINSLFLNVITAATSASIVFEYWNGDINDWTQITGIHSLQDLTNGLTESNSVRWDRSLMTGWAKMIPPNHGSSYNLYWVRIRSTSVMTVAPTVQVATPQGNKRFAVYAGHFDNTPAMYIDGLGNIVMSKQSGSALTVINTATPTSRVAINIEPTETALNVYKTAVDENHKTAYKYGGVTFATSGVAAEFKHKFNQGYSFKNNHTDLLLDIGANGLLNVGAVGYEALIVADNDIPNKKYVDQLLAGNAPQGNWDAATNTPDITGTTTVGYSWAVSVSGTTVLGSISAWYIGDVAIKTTSGWLKSVPSPAVWGTIIGTLSAQGDLQNAFNQKVSTTYLDSWNGATSVSTLGTISAGTWQGSRIDKNYLDTLITAQGNTFNGAQQLVQTTAAGKIPALDGSLVTGLSGTQITVDGASFAKTLHTNDTNVELALETLDQHQHSVGAYNTGLVSDNGDGTINITSGIVYLYESPVFVGHISRNEIPARSNVALTQDVVTYLVADWNNGTPLFRVTPVASEINGSSVVLIASMFRESSSSEIHFIDTDFARATSTRINDRLINQQRFVRTSGLGLNELSGRIITVGGGNVYYGIRSNILPGVDLTTDTCTLYYHTSAGAWTNSFVSQYNNSQYDLSGLVALSAGQYTVNWVYRFIEQDKHIAITMGTSAYTISEAKNSQPPMAPSILQRQAILVGRIIVKAGDEVATQIDGAFITSYETTPVQDHNNLGGIQGGNGGYYHLNTEEHATVLTGLMAWSSATTDVGANSANWNTAYSLLNSNSGQWQSVYSTVSANSANWNSVLSTVGGASANWESVYSNVGSNSAGWESTRTTVALTSGAGAQGLATVAANSATWNTVTSKLIASDFNGYSGSVNTTLTGLRADVNSVSSSNLVVNSNANVLGGLSANWNSVYSSVGNTSANWNNVYSSVTANSSIWNTVTGRMVQSDFNIYSGTTNVTLTGLRTDITATSSVILVHSSNLGVINPLTANWNSVYSSVNANSAGWNSTQSTFNANSAIYNTVTGRMVQSDFNSYSGSINNTLTGLRADVNNVSSQVLTLSSSILVINPLTADWNSVVSTFNANSAIYNTVTGRMVQSDFNSYSGSTNVTLTGLRADVNSISSTVLVHSSNLSTILPSTADWTAGYNHKITQDAITGVISGNGAGLYTGLTVGNASGNLVSRSADNTLAADTITGISSANVVKASNVTLSGGGVLVYDIAPTTPPLSGTLSGALIYTTSGNVHSVDNIGTIYSMPNLKNYRTVRATQNTSNSSNTNYVNATGLSFEVNANTLYYFEFEVLYQSTATNTGITLQMNGPLSPLGFAAYGMLWSTATAPIFGHGRTYATVIGTTSTTDAANATTYGTIKGHIHTGVTAGTLIVRFRSSRNNTSVSIRTDSFGKLYELQ